MIYGQKVLAVLVTLATVGCASPSRSTAPAIAATDRLVRQPANIPGSSDNKFYYNAEGDPYVGEVRQCYWWTGEAADRRTEQRADKHPDKYPVRLETVILIGRQVPSKYAPPTQKFFAEMDGVTGAAGSGVSICPKVTINSTDNQTLFPRLGSSRIGVGILLCDYAVFGRHFACELTPPQAVTD